MMRDSSPAIGKAAARSGNDKHSAIAGFLPAGDEIAQGPAGFGT
jgi:hypothetical protein